MTEEKLLRQVRLALAALLTTGILAGCSSHDMVNNASRPGKFRHYSCDELTKYGFDLVKRERELSALMEKAKQGAGGEFVSTIAYQSEYNIVQGDLLAIDQLGAERNCVLKHRSVSERAVR